jgi:acyl-coenzyme A thioesterase PaaI-like protein
VIAFGRRVAYAEARLVDAAGVLYATATSTLLVMDK